MRQKTCITFRFALNDTVRLGKRAPRGDFHPDQWTYTYLIVKRAYEETSEGCGVVYDIDALGDARKGYQYLWEVPQRYLTPVAVLEAFEAWQTAVKG